MDSMILILTLIGTLATVISTIIAVRAKNESQNILEEITNEKNRNVNNSGSVVIENPGVNSGIVSAINTGEIKNDGK